MTQALESLKPVDEGNSGAEDTGASFSRRGEVFSAERMAYANYLKIECGVSMEKLPMVLALTHLFWLGEEPRADQLPSAAPATRHSSSSRAWRTIYAHNSSTTR
jgi:hypothetical protein